MDVVRNPMPIGAMPVIPTVPVQNPELPILFLSGEDDPCYINKRKWKQAVERLSYLGYEDIHAILFERMRHEIHNEEEREKVFEELDRFVQRIVQNP